MNRLLLFGIGAVIVATIGCSRRSEIYDPNAVLVLNCRLVGEGIELEFRDPSGGGYVCPGVSYEFINQEIHFRFVCDESKAKPEPVLVPDLVKLPTDEGTVTVLFPLDQDSLSNGKQVSLFDSGGSCLGTWTESDRQT